MPELDLRTKIGNQISIIWTFFREIGSDDQSRAFVVEIAHLVKFEPLSFFLQRVRDFIISRRGAPITAIDEFPSSFYVSAMTVYEDMSVQSWKSSKDTFTCAWPLLLLHNQIIVCLLHLWYLPFATRMATDFISKDATVESSFQQGFRDRPISESIEHHSKTRRQERRQRRTCIRQAKFVKIKCSQSTLQPAIDALVKPRRKKEQLRAARPFTFWETQKREHDTIDRSLLSSELMLMFDLFGVDMYHRVKLDNISDNSAIWDITSRQCSYGSTFTSLGSIMSKFERRLLIGINRATSIDATDILSRVTPRICESARLWDAHVDRMLRAGKIFQIGPGTGPDTLLPCLRTMAIKDDSDWVLLYPWSDILRALTDSKSTPAASIDKVFLYIKCRAEQLTELKRNLACAGTYAIGDSLHLIDKLATTLSKHATELSSIVNSEDIKTAGRTSGDFKQHITRSNTDQ